MLSRKQVIETITREEVEGYIQVSSLPIRGEKYEIICANDILDTSREDGKLIVYGFYKSLGYAVDKHTIEEIEYARWYLNPYEKRGYRFVRVLSDKDLPLIYLYGIPLPKKCINDIRQCKDYENIVIEDKWLIRKTVEAIEKHYSGDEYPSVYTYYFPIEEGKWLSRRVKEGNILWEKEITFKEVVDKLVKFSIIKDTGKDYVIFERHEKEHCDYCSVGCLKCYPYIEHTPSCIYRRQRKRRGE